MPIRIHGVQRLRIGGATRLLPHPPMPFCRGQGHFCVNILGYSERQDGIFRLWKLQQSSTKFMFLNLLRRFLLYSPVLRIAVSCTSAVKFHS